MLNSLRLRPGFTMVELAVGLAIVAILLAAAVPAFTAWIGNARIRSTAEVLLNGIQLARAEAVRRNTRVRFQLTDTAGANCVIAETGPNWVVSQGDVTHRCNAPPADPPPLPTAPDPSNPYIVQAWFPPDGSTHVAVATEKPLICFDGLGRQPPIDPDDDPCGGAAVSIEVGGPDGDCAADGGSLRCLRITMSLNGQSRICDPAVSGDDPRAC